jgi:predicted dienelactone hydrolase
VRPVAVLAAALLLAAGCAGGGDDDASGSSTSATPSSSVTSTVPPTTVPQLGCPEPVDGRPADAGPFAVGRLQANYVDPSRRTEPPAASGRPATAGRVLPVVVLYPSVGDPAAPVTDGAGAAPGRFPVVVYSHGVYSSGTERHEALSRWVSAGYVVVAPTFPLSSRPSIDVADLPNQPADVEFVAETFRSEVQKPDHPLHGRVLTDCLALAGHSLGGATTLAAAFDPCCGASDPSAVVDIAGVAVNVTPGASFADADPLPTLIVHGVRDAVVPYAQSETAFATLPGPHWFVTITDGQHSSMFEPPEVEVLTDSVVAFLDAQLKGSPGALEALPATIDASGIATLQVAPPT